MPFGAHDAEMRNISATEPVGGPGAMAMRPVLERGYEVEADASQ